MFDQEWSCDLSADLVRGHKNHRGEGKIAGVPAKMA